jgi:signal transduction histidine kinase
MTLENPLSIRVEQTSRLGFTNGTEPSDTVSQLSNDWFSGELLETLPAAVYVCDAEGIVVAYNRRASQLWGRTPLPGDTDERYCGSHKLFRPDGMVLPHHETPMEAVLRTGTPARDMEVVIERPDSSRITVLVNIAPLFGDDGKLVGAVNCFQGLSASKVAERERVQLAEGLHQAKKLEAIGQLTAGIVHDFNNLLMAIHGNLELLTNRTKEASFLRLLLNATRSVERGEQLTQQLLAFARKQVLSPQAVDLNQVLVRVSNLLQTSVGSSVPIETRPQPGLWQALVDPNQIELVLLNLVINARDAMPDGGTLTIETGNATLTAINHPVDLPAGEYVVVSVTDTGTGMSDEVRAKAFEPFFTTKAEGKGSGLGLSMVRGVAQQSRGDVRIRSRAGEGTSIEVYLPRTQSVASSQGKAAAAITNQRGGEDLRNENSPVSALHSG